MRYPLIMILFACASACSMTSNVGESDGGADVTTPPTRSGPYDECGNGMDDDVDGRIDEGCWCGAGETQACFGGSYPNRGVGTCADGIQRCEVEGSVEFGAWGACTGDATPAAQRCDGTDDDCDGAIDEGCACEAGESRSCAGEFPMAGICRAGEQSCGADGLWSACVDAVGPAAEDCDNELDDDCDGLVNEGCDCTPTIEVCDDGVDNDCDGVTDEPACRASVDGGVPDDGGPVDGGVPGPTGIDRCDTSDLVWDRLSRPATEPMAFSSETARGVWTGTEYVWAYGAEDTSGEEWIYVSRYDADAAHLGTERTAIRLSGLFDKVRGMVWTGAELVVAYTTASLLTLQRLVPDGSSVGAPVMLPGPHGFVAFNGSRIGAAYLGTGGSGLFFQTFDASLASAGSTVEVLPPGAGTGIANLDFGGQGLAWSGRRWVFAWSRTDTTTVHMAVLTDTTLESTRQAEVPGSPDAQITKPTLAGAADGGIWCYEEVFGRWDYAEYCRRFDGLGVPTEPAFVLAPRTMVMGVAVGAIRWGSGYVLVYASAESGSSTSYVLRDGASSLEAIATPADMNGSQWGFSYWNSNFGEVLGSPGALVMSSRGDFADGTRHGNVPARVRLRCRP